MSALRNRPLLQWGWGAEPSKFSFHQDLLMELDNDERRNLADFHIVGTILDYERDRPARRSGHRVFITEDFLYAVGGYDNIGHGFVYRDVWRMNLLTQEWERLHIEDEESFPTALASFAICQTEDFSNQILLFGGTAIPFGERSSSQAFILSIDEENGVVKSFPIEAQGDMRPVYGHVLIRDDNPINPKFYSVGGTSGVNFFLDVDCLQLNSENKWEWSREAAGPTDGLYRMEGIYVQENIILLGGGTPQMVKDFEKLIVFNVVTREYSSIPTFPDQEQLAAGDILGYPSPRRCHSVTRFGNKLIVAGGCSEDIEEQDDGDALNVRNPSRFVNIYGDVWILDLTTFRWSRHPHDLTIPVFFHSAAISKDGCLYIFGGVEDKFSKSRVDICQSMWLQPPSLLYFAGRAVDRQSPERSAKSTVSRPLEIASSLLS